MNAEEKRGEGEGATRSVRAKESRQRWKQLRGKQLRDGEKFPQEMNRDEEMQRPNESEWEKEKERERSRARERKGGGDRLSGRDREGKKGGKRQKG